MQKSLTYTSEGKCITVNYRKVRGAKGMRITISSGNKVVITGSTRSSFRSLEIFFALHKAWAEKKLLHFQKFPNPTIKLSKKKYDQKKEQSRKLVLEKLHFWNQYYQFQWKQVTIRNQSTRWGSCSSAGTLSFHAGLIDLSEELQDYLIVHELCHLQAMNHSAQFWKLVERTLPDAKKLDIRLKKYDSARIM